MDFTPELSAFQGVIISADNVHSFGRLTARGGFRYASSSKQAGNEDQIDYIIENLLRFLHQQNYISQNVFIPEQTQKMRKFAFYVILNADLSALEALLEIDGVASVIWTVPTIPKCLMSEMLWKLSMGKFVYESVAFSCPRLAFELAGALIEYVKYFTPSESLHKIRLIASALYKQVCRLHFFNQDNNVLTNMLTMAINNLQKCLNYFIEPPNGHKLVSLKKDSLYKFKGKSLETMFHLIYECLDEFTGVQAFSPANFNEIYQLTYEVGTYKEDPLNFATCNSPNKSILECLDKCNEMLLDVCKVLVMDISVDIFCAWSEFEDGGQNMQQTIGEFCYKLRTKLLNINVISEHPVVNMIQQISRKPVELQDEINVADIETIVKNIEKNDENRPQWVRALLRKGELCEDSNLIDTLISNLDVLKEDEYYNLYKLLKRYLDDNLGDTEKVKTLAVKVFQNCSINNKNELLDEHFKDKCFTDSLEISDYNDILTETFNKVISQPDADLSGILTVFLQNPQGVYTKIFNLSAESSQAADIMLQAMKLLQKYSNHYYKLDTEPCIVRIAETVLEDYLGKEVTQQNFIKFISSLKTANIIPGPKLLLLIIMPKLHKALLDKDVSRIHFQCKLLAEAFNWVQLLPYRAPMLAMIAQILEVVRWKITTFIVESPSALQLALNLQMKLISTYDEKMPDKEESWLKSKLHKLHPLNCYYYRRLWNPPGQNFVEIVSGTTIGPDTDAQQLQSWLSQVLCSTTQEEWCMIWDALSGFSVDVRLNSILNVLTVLTVTEAMNRNTSNSWQCIQQCYRNLVYIIRYKYFKEPLTAEQVTTVVQKITSVANFIDEPSTEAISTVFLPLFVYMVTRKADYTVDVSNLLSEQLTNNSFKAAIGKVFSDTTSGLNT